MTLRPPQIQLSTAANMIFRIAVIIGVTESIIMAYFNVTGINPLGALAGFLNALFLVILASPLLYFFVVRPFILSKEAQHSALKFLAHHDELTQLSNRRMFDEYFKRCLPSLARQRSFGALIYFDLDGFKPINDEYGHEMGDRVLVELGARLTSSMRSEEITARVGGDEFIILIQHAGLDRADARNQAEILAQRIQRLVNEPMNIQGLILQVGCSIGVHMLTPSSQSSLFAMKAADTAMYQAKKSGSGSIIFSDSLQQPKYDIVSIGVIEIDQEHEEIDHLLSALFDNSRNRVTGMAALLTLVEDHFRSEVEISRRLGLNMTKEHRVEHAHLLTLLKKLNPEADEPAMLEQLATIGKMLQEHVLEFDRSLGVNTHNKTVKPEFQS